MAPEFCPHLDGYAANFARAEAAYGAVSAAVERILAHGSTPDHLDLLEVAVGDWRHEVKQLRARFLTLVRRGVVGLPAAGEDDGAPGGPVCAVCGFAVPRLAWSDWQVEDQAAPTFRGRELPVGEALAVP